MDIPLALNIATTVAVVGGVIFGAWQIRVAAKARTTQVSLQLIEMLYSRDLMEGLSALNDLPEGLSWRELPIQLGDRWTAVFTLINTLDGLGILVFGKRSRMRWQTIFSTTQSRSSGRRRARGLSTGGSSPDARPVFGFLNCWRRRKRVGTPSIDR
jgi:hypothetical protein